ncbi:MAG: hypothetical protein KAF27_06780 [Porphyrobacter sp.]|nr:hypothetical protein [Porphyrobacter sp.]
MSKPFFALPLTALALAAVPAALQAQNYSDLPPLTPMGQNELRALPSDMRSAPAPVTVPMQMNETVTTVNGVETITRTRRIDAARPAPVAPDGYPRPIGMPNPAYAQPQAYAPAYAPAVFEREQWIEECRRRTRGQNRDRTGLIIGGLLGAIAGGVAGYEIAGAGDRVLGSVLGVGGGGLLGGLLGSLFDGDKKKNLYNCEAALDSYLSAYGAPGGRVASRTIAYPAYDYGYGYGYPQAYSYGYSYAPPPQMVMVPVRTEVQQQVVVRETVREETYTVPGATRIIDPAPRPRPSAKMIKQR